MSYLKIAATWLVLLLLLLYHSFAVVPSASPCADPNQIRYSYVSNEMDGWKDGWDIWIDKWNDGWMDRSIDWWMCGWILLGYMDR